MAKTAAPRPEFVRQLHLEIEQWLSQGLIDPAAAERLRVHYPPPPATDWRGRVVTALSVIASTLLGMGVILFFASNWEKIPRSGKLGLVMVILAGAYFAGWYLRYKKDFPKVGSSIIFLGAILYGAAIALVAQAFNLREHYANGFLLWSVGILPLVLIESSAPILILFTGVFCAWSGIETIEFHNFGLVPLVVILGVVFPLAYRLRSRLAVGGAITALAYFMVEGWLYDTSVGSGHGSNLDFLMLITLAAIFGVGLWVAGEVHQRTEGGRRYALLFQFPGLLLVLGVLYAFSFPGLIGELGNHLDQSGVSSLHFTGGAIALIVVSVIAAAVVLPARLTEGRRLIPEFTAGAGVAAFLLLMNVVALPGIGDDRSAASLVGVFDNFVLFGLLVGMIVIGHRRERRLLVNLGMAGVAVVLGTRYVDWFWGMMPTSLFFIVGGIVFLAGGIGLERQRRRLLPPAREGRS